MRKEKLRSLIGKQRSEFLGTTLPIGRVGRSYTYGQLVTLKRSYAIALKLRKNYQILMEQYTEAEMTAIVSRAGVICPPDYFLAMEYLREAYRYFNSPFLEY